MTQAPKLSEISATDTTNWAFFPTSVNPHTIAGVLMVPMVISVNNRISTFSPTFPNNRNSLVSKRQRSTARAEALIKGRERLANVVTRLNQNEPETLANLRLRAGLSQRELANKMDTQQPNIARWESNPKDMKLFTAVRLSTALGVTVEDLVKVTGLLTAEPGAIND